MGFDIGCIPNIELLPGELFCPVCRLLVYPNEALQSMCTHLYCKPCLASVASTTRACPYDSYLVTETDAKPLVESNKVLADTIGNIMVHCLYQMSGCTWLGPLSQSSSHCSGCAFGSSLVVCNWCGIIIAHRQGQEHGQVCLGLQQVQYASQHQVPYVYPSVQYVAQTHSQVQAQPQLQSHSLALHQPHAVYPSAPHKGPASLPQAVPPHSQDPSQAFPSSQDLQNLQAHHLQNAQVPQYQQFHGQINSQLHIQNPLHPQANTVQTSVPQNTTGQGHSHNPHPYWTGQKVNPQPNQTNQVGIPPNNMLMYHQPPHVQNHFPQQVPHARPPQSLPRMQKQQPSLPSQSTRTPFVKQLVLKYGGVSVSESSVMHPAQQPSPNNHHSTTASQESSSQAAPCFPAMKQRDMQKTPNQVPHASYDQGKVPLNPTAVKQGDEAISDATEAGSTSESTNAVDDVKHAVEITATKLDLEPKGKRTDSCAESDKRSSTIMECKETKTKPIGKQVKEEDDDGGPRSPIKMPNFHGDGPFDHGLGGDRKKGDMGPFQNSRKRKTTPVGWCYICEFDCETLEGLDLHSRAKQHQRRLADIILMMRQSAKKLQTAPEDCSPSIDPNKMKKTDSDKEKKSSP